MKLIIAKMYACLWSKFYGYQLRFDAKYDYIGWDGDFAGLKIIKIYAVTSCGVVVKEFYGVQS